MPRGVPCALAGNIERRVNFRLDLELFAYGVVGGSVGNLASAQVRRRRLNRPVPRCATGRPSPVRHAELDDVPGCPFYARLGFVEIPRETPRPELAGVVSEEAHRGLDPHTRAVRVDRCGPTAIRE